MMAAIRDKTKSPRIVLTDGDEPISVAQQQLQQLLRRQLHTKEVSVRGALDQSRDFAPAITFKPLSSEIAGLHSLKQYQTKKEDYNHVDDLRKFGLTEEEIELKLSCDGLEPMLPNPPKRRKVMVDPVAQQERVEALNQKITSRKEFLQKPLQFTGARHMSRHAMEIEKSLFLDRGNPLTHLTVEDPQHHVVYPSSVVIPKTDSNPPSSSSRFVSSAESDGGIAPLPLQVMERNRLSEAEIRAIPRFKDYTPGEPSKVLYLKNLHHSVSENDLRAIFGSLKIHGVEVFGIRLLRGKLRGQAFVEFTTQDGADLGFKTVNGFLIKEKTSGYKLWKEEKIELRNYDKCCKQCSTAYINTRCHEGQSTNSCSVKNKLCKT